MRHVFVLRDSGAAEEIGVDRRDGGWILTRGVEDRALDVRRLPDGRLSLLSEDGRQVSGRVRSKSAGELEISTADGIAHLSLSDRLRDRLAHAAQGASGGPGEEQIRAQIPGRVVEVSAAEGDRVAAGELLLVLEAMKMQNEIRALHEGCVGRVFVSAGQTVDAGEPMMTVRSDRS